MSSIQRTPSDVNGNRRSYIATENFMNAFFSYKREVLARVTDDETQCPAGRVLRESGRRLFPDSSPGINQYYVGVYDPVTFLKGFIDPNGGIFAEFNTNKPNYLDDNYSHDGKIDDDTPDAGDPVYTKGNVTAVAYNPNSSSNTNTIQLLDIPSGSRAFMAFDDQKAPYIECDTNDNGNNSNAYMFTEPGLAEFSGTVSNNGTAQLILTAPNNGEARVELDANGFVGAYASDGSIYNSGVIHPYNTCGLVTLANVGGTSLATATIPSVTEPIVIISRKTIAGTDIGNLQWDVTGTTLTITSTDNRDRSVVSWLLVSSAD
jgi:hypothetical protein